MYVCFCINDVITTFTLALFFYINWKLFLLTSGSFCVLALLNGEATVSMVEMTNLTTSCSTGGQSECGEGTVSAPCCKELICHSISSKRRPQAQRCQSSVWASFLLLTKTYHHTPHSLYKKDKDI